MAQQVKGAAAVALDRNNELTAKVQDFAGHLVLFVGACYLIYEHGHKLAV